MNWETAFNSPMDIIDMPSSVTRMNPTGLKNYLSESGINVGTHRQGDYLGIPFENGGGFNANFRSPLYGDSYIQYSPGSGYHNNVPYYKVSSGNIFDYMGKTTGTQRFYLNGGVMRE